MIKRRKWLPGLLAVGLALMLGCLPARASLSAGVYDNYPDMVIEWLKFRMDPALRQQYIDTDSQIWTPALAEYAGFIDKVTWLDPAHADEVVFVIRWASREQWKAIGEDELTEITQRFDAAFGAEYEMVESKEFYPQP
ncbi:MAG: TIGR03792 family protein [Cyanobacteria bacterium P01_D01_bin.14]